MFLGCVPFQRCFCLPFSCFQMFLFSDVPALRCCSFPLFLFPDVLIFRCSCFQMFPFPDVPAFRCCYFQMFLFSDVPIFRCSCFPLFLFSNVPVCRCSCFPVFLFLCSSCKNAEARRSRLCWLVLKRLNHGVTSGRRPGIVWSIATFRYALTIWDRTETPGIPRLVP